MIWRSGLLALLVFIGSIGAVLAHALPGSVLLLRQQGSALQLTIQFPLDDLIVAAPELSALEAVAAGQPWPQELTTALARYLKRHLLVTDGGAPLDLTMTDARIHRLPRWIPGPSGRGGMRCDTLQHALGFRLSETVITKPLPLLF